MPACHRQGYKNHAKVDATSKFIDNYTVTPARLCHSGGDAYFGFAQHESVHDSQALDNLLTEKDEAQDFPARQAGSAYTGEEQEKVISKHKMKNKVHEKGYRNKPLTPARLCHSGGDEPACSRQAKSKQSRKIKN